MAAAEPIGNGRSRAVDVTRWTGLEVPRCATCDGEQTARKYRGRQKQRLGTSISEVFPATTVTERPNPPSALPVLVM
jgi:hypothetical protein